MTLVLTLLLTTVFLATFSVSSFVLSWLGVVLNAILAAAIDLLLKGSRVDGL